MEWETHNGSWPVNIHKKEGELGLLWKGEPTAWPNCCPETRQVSLHLHVRDPGTFLETSSLSNSRSSREVTSSLAEGKNSNSPQDRSFETAGMLDSGGRCPGGGQGGRGGGCVGEGGSRCPPTGSQGDKGEGHVNIFDLHMSSSSDFGNVHVLLLESIFLCP